MSLCYRKIVYFLFLIVFTLPTLLIGLFLLGQETKAYNNLQTSVEVIMVCGDGVMVEGEACDKGNPPNVSADFGTSTCADYGYNEGVLTCSDDCLSVLTTMCSTCGNNIREGLEQCEATDYNGATCATYGLNTGTLTCASNCVFDLINCSSVGLTEPGDAGNQGGASGGVSSIGGVGVLDGYLPGSFIPPSQTKVIIRGKSFPNTDVHVLIDGKIIGMVRADSKADFYFESTDVTPGIASFGLWSEDIDSTKSTLLTLTLRITSGAVTTVTGAYISPSINVDKNVIIKGESLKIYGQSVPEAEIQVLVHSDEEIVKKTSTESNGTWNIDLDTNPLEEEVFHITKALFQISLDGNKIKSGYSRSVSFYVGRTAKQEPCPGADLNKDKRVNLTDFSILLYYWGTDNACADQNHNNKVDLVDFSIMMYYWTG
jgi:hypothetical protein